MSTSRARFILILFIGLGASCAPQILPPPRAMQAMRASDLDGDGDLDLGEHLLRIRGEDFIEVVHENGTLRRGSYGGGWRLTYGRAEGFPDGAAIVKPPFDSETLEPVKVYLGENTVELSLPSEDIYSDLALRPATADLPMSTLVMRERRGDRFLLSAYPLDASAPNEMRQASFAEVEVGPISSRCAFRARYVAGQAVDNWVSIHLNDAASFCITSYNLATHRAEYQEVQLDVPVIAGSEGGALAGDSFTGIYACLESSGRIVDDCFIVHAGLQDDSSAESDKTILFKLRKAGGAWRLDPEPLIFSEDVRIFTYARVDTAGQLSPVALGAANLYVLSIDNQLRIDHELTGFEAFEYPYPDLGFIDLNGDELDDLAGLRWSDAARVKVPIAFHNMGGYFASISVTP